MPAVAEHAVVHPVGSRRTDSYHREIINKSHDYCEDRQTEPTVCYNLIDLIRSGKAALVFLLIAALDDLCYIDISFIGDDAFGIVVQLILRCFDILFDMSFELIRKIKLCEHFIIALEDLYRIPALTLLRHLMKSRFFDMSDSVLNDA